MKTGLSLNGHPLQSSLEIPKINDDLTLRPENSPVAQMPRLLSANSHARFDTQTIPDAGVLAMSITKLADAGAAFDEVGDPVNSTCGGTNSRTRAFAADISVEDDRLGPIACFTPTATELDFTAGVFVTCMRHA